MQIFHNNISSNSPFNLTAAAAEVLVVRTCDVCVCVTEFVCISVYLKASGLS